MTETQKERVQNEPEQQEPLSGYKLTKCLMTWGISERELGRRLGRSQTNIRKIMDGRAELTQAESDWLRKITDFMRENPPPRQKALFVPPKQKKQP